MSRIDSLNRRYAASATVVRLGVEIIAVGDPIGARFNAATRQLLLVAREEDPGLWGDLVGAARALRWRIATQPQPIELNLALRDGAYEVIRQVRRLRGAVANDRLLQGISATATQVGSTDPALGQVLLRSIEEVGGSHCVVVAASAAARGCLRAWLSDSGVTVLTAGDLAQPHLDVDQSYVVGPPRYFRPSLVNAPVTDQISFVMPAWFGDRAIPRSAISAHAEGAILIKSRVFTEGDLEDNELSASFGSVAEDDLLPQPTWSTQAPLDREPNHDEVVARKLLLSGGTALWLDDGERIRAVDPSQPLGERVTYVEVPSVHVGTYLLLRQGETERSALYQAALERLGSRNSAVDASQQEWKQRLREALLRHGYRASVEVLRENGVKTADRARAWTEPNLVRPHSDSDFESLLGWLSLPTQPYFGNATLLRRALYQASAEIREQLEHAVSAADLSELEREGNLSLDVDEAGFRGIIATRVLAISPHVEIVSRRDVRMPFEDRSGQWLE